METAVQAEPAWQVMRPVQRGRDDRNLGAPVPGKTLWVEVKRPVSKRQAKVHKAFERFVTGIGHTYLLATLGKNRDAVPEKVKVTVQMYRRNPMDRDGAQEGSAKPIFEALVRRGWLKDDSPLWLEEDVKVPRVDETPRSEIVIEEVSFGI